MSAKNGHLNAKQNHDLAIENCAAQHVVHSMLENVAELSDETLKCRSDAAEIAQFSQLVVENEFIFGSPNQQVLDGIQKKIDQKHRHP